MSNKFSNGVRIYPNIDSKNSFIEQHNREGKIYLIEALRYHGIVPGKFPGLKRCKIGLSVDPNMRLQQLESSQPPCDYKIIKTIHVENMAEVEALLHEDFRHCNVSLKKSREWHDLYPWQYTVLLMRFSRYEQEYRFVKRSSIRFNRAIIGILIVLFGVALFVNSLQSPAPKVPATSNSTVKTFTQQKKIKKLHKKEIQS